MLSPLRRALYNLRMHFCDLIVSMEQAQISPRPVVGAIVVVSGLAVSFLLWLLYVHHASADFAGRWMFLPALKPAGVARGGELGEGAAAAGGESTARSRQRIPSASPVVLEQCHGRIAGRGLRGGPLA